MVSAATLREQVRKIKEASTQEEQLYKILQVFMNLYPVLNANLINYSPLTYLGQGIFRLDQDGLVPTRETITDVRTYKAIYNAILERKAKYYEEAELYKNSAMMKIISSTKCMLVVPICIGPVVIGYIVSSKFPEDVSFDEKTLSSLTLFGQLIGNLFLDGFGDDSNYSALSKREFEVMLRIAQGESTKEMAEAMEISELTVKQYVKTAVTKLGALNRANAVAKLFRMGILF